MATLSPRLLAIVEALPLRAVMRVLEIGGTPGAAARAVARQLGDGHIMVIDRSAVGVAQIERGEHVDMDDLIAELQDADRTNKAA